MVTEHYIVQPPKHLEHQHSHVNELDVVQPPVIDWLVYLIVLQDALLEVGNGLQQQQQQQRQQEDFSTIVLANLVVIEMRSLTLAMACSNNSTSTSSSLAATALSNGSQ
jgi:hypothetical protein